MFLYNMSLALNNIVIESRKSDNFINATQLCKAGGKKFNDWYRLDSTKELKEELKRRFNAGIPAFKKSLVDIKKGRYNSGSWIHPDLAVQLAQWISPSFAIQVSRWIRELFITGSVKIRGPCTKYAAPWVFARKAPACLMHAPCKNV
jgi:hypothetical protein